MEDLIKEVITEFGLGEIGVEAEEFGSGHINLTFLVRRDGKKEYVLQAINTTVFTQPELIASNVGKVASYLKEKNPDYLFVDFVKTPDGRSLVYKNDTCWRLTRYIPGSVSFDVLTDPTQAYEAARQFGRLSRLLADFDVSLLKPTIPRFHDLEYRYRQFIESTGHEGARLEKGDESIIIARRYHYLIDYYNSYKNSAGFPDRVMHHDTKISNMLFDRTTMKGLCVIDLDTMMPGKFISDLGDMIRTYVCPFPENEPDPDKIFIREEYFEAVVRGYLDEMRDILTPTEKGLILFSGKYMIYMQALRFLTDFLNGDVYYPVSYPDENLVRANNQFKLLSELTGNEKVLQSMINRILK